MGCNQKETHWRSLGVVILVTGGTYISMYLIVLKLYIFMYAKVCS